MNTNKKLESSVSTLNEFAYSEAENLVQDFACRGVVVLSPESLEIPSTIHDQVYDSVKNLVYLKKTVSPITCPAILKVLNAPGLISAVNQLVGENWAIVPFTHNAPFISGSMDQHWHKDDNGPYNARKQRHHQTVQIEMLYFPEYVTEEMGPTAIIPYSHYWTFDHEENHDNFAGADHLDFNYLLSGMEDEPVSGPQSKYSLEEIAQRRTKHDIRMKEEVLKTGWPLVKQIEAAPLRAGSVVLYSHNTFHRGNHRRDDWKTWENNPRFMWRFFIYRTTDIDSSASNKISDVSWDQKGIDPITMVDLGKAGEELTTVWRYHYYWMKTGNPPPIGINTKILTDHDKQKESARLFELLHTKYDQGEPVRIGAAYQIAALGDSRLSVNLLGKALLNERENVRRAATYGLVAVGSDATNLFMEATKSTNKWIRKAGVYGFGAVSYLTKDAFEAVVKCLKEDTSVYVKSVAADALGSLSRKAIAKKMGIEFIPNCLNALLECLATEENRIAMNISQGRSIKFVRPNDDCDVCEGNGIDFGLNRFQKVRSIVRENALNSIVIICSHGPEILGAYLERTIFELKKIVEKDKNVISVGFAMDALNRLAYIRGKQISATPIIRDLQNTMLEIQKESPLFCAESLVRCGPKMEDNETMKS